ncbi:ScyE family PEP-CTERM sorting domain-containing protein [cyanobacterium TDX16]|nr:ScyE family PEP-CTERM sorting domain-containing protein [cyanobacterium TDX16]
MKLKQFTITFITVCIATVFGPQAARAVSLTPIADGLNQPRGIDFGSDGSIYVGETGSGGDGNCQGSPSTQGELICAGNTGSVTKIAPDGQQERLFENFESLALQPTGNQGAGPQELSFDSSGDAYLLTGYAGFPGNRDPELNTLSTNIPLSPEQGPFAPVPADRLLNTSDLGQLYKADLNTQQLTPIFDFAKYELLNNPDGGDVVSNPYDMTISGNTAYVADGGANVLYTVKLDGSDTKAIPIPRQTIENPEFPPAPPGQEPFRLPGQTETEAEVQAVPTGVTIGPDGAAYLGEYTGYPYAQGGARVYRLNDKGELEVYADGFNAITDIKFDKDGNLLVLQFTDEAEWKGKDITQLPGSLIKVAPDGTRTVLVNAGEGLESATGLAVGPDGQIYVTNKGVGPGNGEVFRVDGTGVTAEAVPEPSSILGLLVFGVIGGGTWFNRKQQQDREAIAPQPKEILPQPSIEIA